MYAFVLHSAEYQEDKFLLDCITSQFGRLRLVAKQSPALFRPITINVFGTGELKKLTQWQYDTSQAVVENKNLIIGFYLNELLVKLLKPLVADEKIYGLYASTLQLINSSQQASALRFFEKQLLNLIGFGVDFERDSNDALINEESCYWFDVQMGFLPSPKGNIKGDWIKQMAQNHWQLEHLQKPAKYIFRQRIDYALQGKTLNSRQLVVDYLKKGSNND